LELSSTDVKRPPTPLFQLFQIASVVVSNALWKWPVRTESERLWQLTEAYISKAKAPRKTVVRKTAFLRNKPLSKCQRVIRVFGLRWKYLKRPDAICGRVSVSKVALRLKGGNSDLRHQPCFHENNMARHSFLEDSCSFKSQEGCLRLGCLKFESLSFREVLIGSGLASCIDRFLCVGIYSLGEVVAIKSAP